LKKPANIAGFLLSKIKAMGIKASIVNSTVIIALGGILKILLQLFNFPYTHYFIVLFYFTWVPVFAFEEPPGESIKPNLHNQTITMCVDPNWLPYEKINSKNEHIGIAADYFELLTKHTGVKFKLVVTQSWADSQKYVQQGKCQILSLLNKTPERSKYLNFTQPYLRAVVVLVGQESTNFISGLTSISDQTLAVVEGYIYLNYIRENFPNIKIILVGRMEDTLVSVAKGNADLAIASMPVALHFISELGLSNLKIVGNTNIINDLRIGVHKSKPELVALLDKAISEIDPVDIAKIKRRWRQVRIERGTDYVLIFRVAFIFLIILVFFLYRYFILQRFSKKQNALNIKLQIANEKLTYLSSTDYLTKIANRAKIESLLQREVARCQRYLNSFVLIIFDIDYFKKVNDTRGHQIGDRVLIDIANRANSVLRDSDFIGRWGGEEFLIVCPNSNISGAKVLAEKLRNNFCQLDIEGCKVTVSFGVAEFRIDDSVEDIIFRADQALYKAKDTGRNKVVLESELT